MTRLFYDKHVPQDPLLEPLFAHMSPDHPERVAAWLGEVFGGLAVYSDRYSDGLRAYRCSSDGGAAGALGKLDGAVRRGAGLPADPEFRAAFAAYIEWGSRLAVENSTPGGHPPMNMPVPRWD